MTIITVMKALLTHLMTGRDFGLVNLRFSCDGSVTYFSAFCLRRRNPVDNI